MSELTIIPCCFCSFLPCCLCSFTPLLLFCSLSLTSHSHISHNNFISNKKNTSKFATTQREGTALSGVVKADHVRPPPGSITRPKRSISFHSSVIPGQDPLLLCVVSAQEMYEAAFGRSIAADDTLRTVERLFPQPTNTVCKSSTTRQRRDQLPTCQ